MRRLVIAAAVATVGASGLLSATVFTPSADAATCRDGSYSYSYGSGTCSWHGGIDRSYPYKPIYQSHLPPRYRTSPVPRYYPPRYQSPSWSTTYHDRGYSTTYNYGTGSWSRTYHDPGRSTTYHYPSYGGY
jgi:Protein of unknown function (DUF3761)